jgi:hypothetical protein
LSGHRGARLNMAPKDNTLGKAACNLAIFVPLGLYSRVAEKRGVDRSHVRLVAIGQPQSRRITRAMRQGDCADQKGTGELATLRARAGERWQ